MTDKNPKVIGKVILKGRIKLETPLLIGAGENDNFTDILVLKNKEGNPYIPGTSLAGVLRSLDASTEKFFGEIDDMQSVIITSDIELEKAELVIRDSVSIDNVRGVSKESAKFDFELVERGAEGNFEIVATIREFQREEKEEIVGLVRKIGQNMLQGIFMGAKTTSGFGKVTAKKGSVSLAVYDFSKAADVKAWLLKRPASNVETLSATAVVDEKDFVIDADFVLKSSLLVRSSDFDPQDYSKDIKKIASVQMKSLNDYVIPGTTLKGVIRNQAINICNALGKKSAAIVDAIFGFADNNKSSKKGSLIAEETYIKDFTKDYAQTRNKIDRFTGATVDNALFTNVPIWQEDKNKASVHIRLVLKKYETWQAGLLLFVLKDLWTGQVAVGGEKSIGRGTLQGINAKLQFANKTISIQDFAGFTVDDKESLEALAKAFVDYEG